MSSIPRVLRIINRFNLGGPTFNAAYLTKYLDNYETLLIGGEKLDSEESSLFITDQLGLKPTIISEMTRSVGIMNDIRAYRKICMLIREFKPDLVHTHASKAGALGRLAAWRMGVPHVVHTFHGHVFEGYFNPIITSAVIQTERFLARRTDRIIAISNKQKKDLTERFRIAPEVKTSVVPLGFELERFEEEQEKKRASIRTAWGLKEADVAIGIVGRLVPIKDHEFFLKVLAGVREKGIPFRAFIIGDGELRENLQKMATELRLDFSSSQSELQFVGWQKEMDIIMAGLDIVALTSINEGTPVSLIEAQAASRPIISTNVGGVWDVIPKESQPFIIEKGHLEKYVEQLCILLNNKAVRTSLGEAGRNMAFSHFNVARLVSDVDKLYQKVLAE